MSAFKLPRAETAFSVAPARGRRRPREKDGAHLAFLRKLPCVACGTRQNVEAAHLRTESRLHGKRETGMGEKPHDKWALPVCHTDHSKQHTMSETEFWISLGIDPFGLALALYAATGDEEVAEGIIQSHLARGKTVTS